LRVCQIASIEIPPPDKILIAVYQVVKCDWIETAAVQFLAAMRTDITGPAGNEYIDHM
jgi:hypothetical protein